MAEVRRIRATWTGIAGTPYLSTWHFENVVGKASEIVTATRKFLTTVAAQATNAISVTLEADQAIFDAATGDLIGMESTSPGAAINGGLAGDMLPPANQGVLRLATGGIVNNRRVRGRFYIPGMCEANSTGVPAAGLTTVFNTAGSTLIVDSVATGAWVVYSRPLKAEDIPAGSSLSPRAGSIHDVQAATGWNKWGVQRRRRD